VDVRPLLEGIDCSLMSLFVMLMMVRINYYIATVWPKARYLLGDEDGEKVNHLFDVALPRTSIEILFNG
jgi:hypothetical protein